MLRRAASEEKARTIFERAARALDTEQGLPVGADARASRTIRMPGEEYLEDSRKRGKQPRTMEGRQSRLNAHILPTIGDVPVSKWRIQHSRAVIEKGAKTPHSQRGREDLRGQLAAMRKLAWHLGWLDRSIDPAAASTSDDPPCSTIDVFFDRGYVLVNGSWVTPRHAPGSRGPVKNQVLHDVPLPRSLMRDELLPRVKELLGLPAKASPQQVVNAQEAERQRRAKLATGSGDRTVTWWNYPIPPEDELWLFVDTFTGLPVKPEMHNERWHRS